MTPKYTPANIDEVTQVFPAHVLDLMPKMEDIPEEFRHGNTPWDRLFSAWFFCGLSKLELTLAEGIDKDKALRHDSSVDRVFEKLQDASGGSAQTA